MKLYFLGTGGSWPTKERSPLAIAASFGSWTILMDCGEGAQRQMMTTSVSPMKIDLVLITHLHGDHFLGFPGLVQSMSLNGRERPLLLAGPKGIATSWKKALSMCYFNPRFDVEVLEMLPGDEISFRDHRIRCIEADHSVPTLSYRIDEPPRRGKFDRQGALDLGIPEGPLWGQLQNGRPVTIDTESGEKTVIPDQVMGPRRPGLSLVYSGDTAPFPEMVEFAMGCDVLIHEATYSDRFSENAMSYKHSTASGAARIAKEAVVRHLFLVHTSPRYTDEDLFREMVEEAREVFPGAEFPSDGDFREITH